MGVITGDATMMLESLLHTFKPDGRGANNSPGISDPKYDDLLAAISGELDQTRRISTFENLQLAEGVEHYFVPLYQPMTPWAMHRRVSIVHRPDNYLDLRWVQVAKK
jgi:peptide/nickel transport system substrate-binding protein